MVVGNQLRLHNPASRLADVRVGEAPSKILRVDDRGLIREALRLAWSDALVAVDERFVSQPGFA